MIFTERMTVDPQHPEPALLERAAQVLRRGGLVAFPTETVYGLGAHALDPQAVAGIYAAKGRPATNPVIVHAADLASARALVSAWPDAAQRLAERFWPGPLTLVLPRGSDIPDVVTAGGPTVAVRVPQHPVALALLRMARIPVAAPSANRSNRLSPTCADHVWRDLAGRLDILLDGGPCSGGLESTVVDLASDPPRILRPGLLTPSQLASVLDGPVRSGNDSVPRAEHAQEQSQAQERSQGPLRSPGQFTRHYAPGARVVLSAGTGRVVVQALVAQNVPVGWLRQGPAAEFAEFEGWPEPRIHGREMPLDPAGYAARLYATLHELDQLGVDVIVIDLPPNSEAWQAIHDRLQRAATPAS